VVDHTVSDVADHDAMLIAADAAGDSLLIYDVLADTCAMDDLAAEVWTCVKDVFEASTKLFLAACNNGAARVLDETVT
jgi:hypothetical protein